MSEEKKIEQEIGWNKLIFTILAAIDVSLFAWFVENYQTGGPFILASCFIAVIIITVSIIAIHKSVLVMLKKLGDL